MTDEPRAHDRLLARVGRALALPFVCAVILGLLQVWGNVGDGYFAGWGDHFVLSPEGMSWAIPGAFENDWFMEAAPQPHWFFDVVTFLGTASGALSAVYAVFWALGLLAFGWATAMLARALTPRAAWPVAIGVTVLMAATPWAVGGTGSPIIAQALPAVLSGNLIYLLIAALICQRRTLAGVVAPLIAVVHVQQGSIAIVLLVSVLVTSWIRARRVDWLYVFSGIVTAIAVVFGLSLRPVASNLNDFVRICDQVIPYHCAAHLWTTWEHVSTLGLIVLAALSLFAARRAHRPLWIATVGLATLGYAGGYAADALRVPLLDTLAQGVNVYRLGAVLVPFAIWGLIAPMVTDLRGRKLVALSVIALGGWVAFLTAPGWATARPPRVVLLTLAIGGVLLWVILRRFRSAAAPSVTTGPAAIVSAALVLVLTSMGGGFVLRAPNFAFISSPDLRAWGEQVRSVVPTGSIIVAPPRLEWVKLVTQRAVVADCKDVPYGGDAWTQWQERLEDLGGADQCVAPGPLLYDKLDADALVAVADKYGSDFIIVNPPEQETFDDLIDRGWSVVAQQVGDQGVGVLRRP